MTAASWSHSTTPPTWRRRWSVCSATARCASGWRRARAGAWKPTSTFVARPRGCGRFSMWLRGPRSRGSPDNADRLRLRRSGRPGVRAQGLLGARPGNDPRVPPRRSGRGAVRGARGRPAATGAGRRPRAPPPGGTRGCARHRRGRGAEPRTDGGAVTGGAVRHGVRALLAVERRRDGARPRGRRAGGARGECAPHRGAGRAPRAARYAGRGRDGGARLRCGERLARGLRGGGRLARAPAGGARGGARAFGPQWGRSRTVPARRTARAARAAWNLYGRVRGLDEALARRPGPDRSVRGAPCASTGDPPAARGRREIGRAHV